VVSFAEPARLWLLALPAAAAVLALLRHHRRVGQQRLLASPGVWERVMGGVPATGLLRLLAWSAAAALLVLALARPLWGELPREESIRTRDLVVALDVSDSMRCPDVRPSRLERGLDELVRALPRLEGNRIGVVVFAGESYPLVPLTTDLDAVQTFIQTVEPGIVGRPGSNLERATAAALKLLPPEGEGRVVVIVSDGENLQGDVETAAGALKDAGVRVLAVVTGTPEGGPIPMPGSGGEVHYKRTSGGQPVVTRAQRETLAQLADAAGGDVLEVSRRDVTAELVAAVERLQTREASTEHDVRRIERFPIFLVAAALAVMAAFVIPPWRRPAAVLLAALLLAGPRAGLADTDPAPATAPKQAPRAAGEPPPGPAEVAWWQRILPGGSRRLARSGSASWRSGDIDRATRRFEGALQLAPRSADRLFDYGTALAATGRLDESAPVLAAARQRGAEGATFNQGTAALEAGDARSAVQWLRQALLESPDDPAAKRNYELALKLLEQQQDQQQKDQQQKDDEQQDHQQDQQPQQNQQPQDEQRPSPAPTPTPDLSGALYDALERAEADAREAMRTPTPAASSVEKDW
jgi:Ca-activated chloride channel family protein